jgi:two-component system chemotaxis sensor kinase CheA
MDISKFKDIFISEVEDHLEKLNTNLLIAEKIIKNKNNGILVDDKKYKELFDELMRSAHTIKSSAATMNYVKMAFLTHVLEDVFDYVRNGKFEIKEDMVSSIFEAVDSLTASLNNIKINNTETDVDNYSQKIKSLTGVLTEGVGPSKRNESGVPIVGNLKNEKKVENKITNFNEDTLVENITFVKVPIKRLDSLMDLTEELLIEKMRLNSLIEIKAENIFDLSKKAVFEKLKPSIEHLNSLISSLQFQVMQSRLVPAGQIFARFPRMIRDLAKQKNKNIELIIKGENLEMDRSIIDKLGEPLLHLLRNAVDHGIESDGTITIEARHDKDYASIVVEDNGSGINWTALVKAALARNIINEEKSIEYLNLIINNKQNIWQGVIEKDLLYNPRLSTSDIVTETSGRGVGTSVVKKFVEEIRGDIVVISPVNKDGGTRFVLNLPLTLAIIKALLVEIEGSVFAIPFSSIKHSVFINDIDIKSVAEQDVAVVDGNDVPLVSLGKIFNLANISKKDIVKDKKIAVLVEKGKEVAGLLVDKLLNEQEIIVKPLPLVLKGVKGFSGSTILGNGEVVLILDVISFL